MIKKQQQFLIKGMNQDIAETKVQPELAHSIKNLRVITDEDSGTLSLVTEKGTLLKTLYDTFTVNFKKKYTSLTVSYLSNYWEDYDNTNNKVNLATGVNLVYSTALYILEATYTFNETINSSNLGYDSDLLPSYFTMPNGKMKPTITINGYGELIYNNDLTFSYKSNNNTITNNVINFLVDTSGTTHSVSSYTFGTPQINGNVVKFYIPVIYFDYTVNNDATRFDNSGLSGYRLSYELQLKKLTSWNCIKTVKIGKILGDCLINNILILFTKSIDDVDQIIKIENFNSSDYILTLLYSGNLNFDVNHPIKTYASYESENQQRVYWIDGLNQPRVINIANSYEMFDDDDDNHFNFCTPIYLKETVDIRKKAIGGFFHSGVIQYFMTYIDQNEQESKIFYQSPLYYITDNDRALSPEENSTNSFVIDLHNVNANDLLRKKLRIYSLHRSSLDAVPVTKLVYELKLTNKTDSFSVTDTGNVGMNIDPQVLLMLGCEEFIPQTMAIKDDTIFFGNIESKNYQNISEEISNTFILNDINISTNRIVHEHTNASYSTNFQLNGVGISFNKNGSDNEIKGFMHNEEYMLGIQFLHKSGSWTEPIWIGDFVMTKSPTHDSDYQYIPYFNTTFASSKFTTLINHGYIAIRPLIVFNDQQSCKVLCQGLLNPTIKYKDSYYPSWFFRPIGTSAFVETTLRNDSYIYCRHVENQHGYNIKFEVQGFNGKFSVQRDFMTFNSPEIEFEKITTLGNNYSFKLIGCSQIHSNTYDIEILTSTTPYKNNGLYGLQASRGTLWYEQAKRTFVGGFCWKDKGWKTNQDGPFTYYVWPWECNQSYSCAPKDDTDIVYSAPERKIISNYRYSQFSSFRKLESILNQEIDDIYLINSNSIRTKSFSTDSDGQKEYVYNKDVDILCTGYLGEETNHHVYENMVSDNVNVSDQSVSGCNVVRIQYKSTPHVLLKLHFDSNITEHYYDILHNNEYPSGSLTYQCGAIHIGELINNAYNDTTKFKGRILKNNKYVPTDTSMYENTWYISGDVKLLDGNNISLSWYKGDTYYQRYDCLKTYPYSHEAENSIVDVLSCMIQTRINLDGRYDKNRCNDILHIEPENFNKLNDVYSQTDNFFTYHKLDPDRFQNTFPNLVTWSKQKVFGESIDSWTNIHLTNVLDLDGSLGKITALKLWNNKLIAFQNKGIALIKYNENAMIPQANGAPIVLMNSGLVSGKEYITNQFGCQNEWSIVNAKSGLYFSDDYNHKLYVLSDGIKCISDEFGFKSYLKNKNYSGIWNPERGTWNDIHTVFTPINTLRTYYDQQLGDIYFTDGSSCLTYNENLNLFTSFYDYVDVGNKKLFDFVNIENKNYWILNVFTNNTPLFYEHRAIDNLNIFDNNKDYEIELTANIDPHVDKIFDTVEIRGDAYISNDLQSGYGDTPPFDQMKVTNEYQDTNPNNENNLTFSKDIPSNVKQKFRIWRAQIGRNQKQLSGESIRITRDRIRNYWSRIKLTKNGTSSLKAKIHDIVVNVYE